MKKLLSVLLTVLMALCVCTINIAAEDEEIDEFAELNDYDAELDGVLVNHPTAKSELVFNGEEQVLINPGKTLGFEYRYRMKDATKWTQDASNIKATDAGTYVVEWQMKSIISPIWVRKIQELEVTIAESEEPIEPEEEKITLQVMFANMTGYANEDGEAEFFISNYEELCKKLGEAPTFEYKEGDTDDDFKAIDYTVYSINGKQYPVFVIENVKNDAAYQMQVKVEDEEHFQTSPTAFQVKKTPLYLGLTDLEIDKNEDDIDASFVFSIKLRFAATNDSNSEDIFVLTIDNEVIPDDAYTVEYAGDLHITDLSYDFLKITLTEDYVNNNVKALATGDHKVRLHMISGQSRGESFNCHSTLTIKGPSSTSSSSSTSQTVVNKETTINKETVKKDSIVRIVSTGVE